MFFLFLFCFTDPFFFPFGFEAFSPFFYFLCFSTSSPLASLYSFSFYAVTLSTGTFVLLWNGVGELRMCGLVSLDVILVQSSSGCAYRTDNLCSSPSPPPLQPVLVLEYSSNGLRTLPAHLAPHQAGFIHWILDCRSVSSQDARQLDAHGVGPRSLFLFHLLCLCFDFGAGSSLLAYPYYLANCPQPYDLSFFLPCFFLIPSRKKCSNIETAPREKDGWAGKSEMPWGGLF